MRGLCSYLIKPKNNSLLKPPSEVKYIGFFDSSFLIHVAEPYTKFFNRPNLYLNGSYKEYKRGVIDLVIHERKILIRKTYKGSLKRKMKFYNEIECLCKLSASNNTPKIYFADYDKLIIYIEYIKGECLQVIINSKQNYPVSLRAKLNECSKNVLKKVHENNIAIIDIQPQNIIYNQNKQDLFFIDFADSVCGSFVPKRYLMFLQKLDEMNLSERVLSKLS